MTASEKYRFSAYLYLAGAMVIVGSSVPVGKFVVAEVPVFLASALRYGIAAAVLVPMLWIKEGRPSAVSVRDGLILLVQAALGTFLFSVLLLYGLTMTTAAEGGIVTGVMPAMVALMSVVLLKDRLTAKKAVAVGLAVAGLLAINLGSTGQEGRGPAPLLGNALVLAAVTAESAFVILGKALGKKRSALFISTVMSLLAFLMFLPFAAFEARNFDFAVLGAFDWAVIAYYGLGVTVAGFLLWFAGVERVAGSTAGTFTALMPVSALLFSYVWLGEAFLMGHAVGCALVLGAILLAVRNGD